jgi:hypothetical protein
MVLSILEFIRVVELGLTNLEPWWIIEGEQPNLDSIRHQAG